MPRFLIPAGFAVTVLSLAPGAPAIAQKTVPWPTEEWSASTPGAQGLDGSPMEHDG